MPGTVPGAGSRITSAPASINWSTSSGVRMFSPASEAIPEACIFPAVRMTRSPTASFNWVSAWMMAWFSTPIPGFPVRMIISTPMSAAFFAFSTVAQRPEVRSQTDSSSWLDFGTYATGSRLMATIFPVSLLISRIVSSGATSGSPWIIGWFTSKILSMIKSDPSEATNSAFVIFTSMGVTVPIVSVASTRPSLSVIALSRSSFV